MPLLGASGTSFCRRKHPSTKFLPSAHEGAQLWAEWGHRGSVKSFASDVFPQCPPLCPLHPRWGGAALFTAACETGCHRVPAGSDRDVSFPRRLEREPFTDGANSSTAGPSHLPSATPHSCFSAGNRRRGVCYLRPRPQSSWASGRCGCDARVGLGPLPCSPCSPCLAACP